MRTKNRPLLLKRACIDILAQSCKDWELLIINDGGEPFFVDEIVSSAFKNNESVKVIHNKDSVGMEAASNLGLKAATGQYIVIHDDDDTWHNSFLEKSVEALESCTVSSVKGVVCQTKIVTEIILSGKIKIKKIELFNPILEKVSLPSMANFNKFTVNAFVYKREVIDTIGYYDEQLPVLGDWDFNLRFLMHYDIVVLPLMLANYHKRLTSGTNDSNTNALQHKFYESIIRNKYARNNNKLGQLLTIGDSLKWIESIVLKINLIKYKITHIF